MTNLDYYDYSKLYSYNGTYNFLVGGRGLGKTYGAKIKAVKDALNPRKNYQFIYLRRYKEELKAARTTFFNDIENEFPDWDFRIGGGTIQAATVDSRTDKKREWLTIGYFISLSTSQNQKSVAFNKVRTIIFDEFIIEKGAIHYLPEEDVIFNNFYSTVDRYKDKTKVYFLANSVSIMNPYFMSYDIKPDKDTDFIIKADGFIVSHFPKAEKFKMGVYETKFGKFIKSTEYAEYAVANTFADNHEAMISAKSSEAKYRFTLECKSGDFSVWYEYANDFYYIQAKLPKIQTIFTLESSKMDSDKLLMSFSDLPLAYLRTAFRKGKVAFDAAKTRNTFIEIFRR